jgi:hypothetical protein
MKRRIIVGLVLISVTIIWLNARGAASSTNPRSVFQLAKHDDQGSQDGDVKGNSGHHHRHGRPHNSAQETYGDGHFCGPYFKPSSVPYFRNYYSRNNYAKLPPGLRKHVQKTGHLPAGVEKKYERTGQLPPGLDKRFECGQALPSTYYSYLYPVPEVAYDRDGPLPPDGRLYLYGNDLILLNDHTKAIIDILRGAY